MKESIGEYLKRERELRQISLEDVAGGTKIAIHMLDALESDSWEEMYAEVFVRGFIKSYAEFIGLIPEEVILRYQEEKATDSGSDEVNEPASSHPEENISLFDRRFTVFIALIFSFFLALGCWFFWSSDSTENTESRGPALPLITSPEQGNVHKEHPDTESVSDDKPDAVTH